MKRFTLLITITLSILSLDAQTKIDSTRIAFDKLQNRLDDIDNRIDDIAENFKTSLKDISNEVNKNRNETLKNNYSLDALKTDLRKTKLSLKEELSILKSSLSENDEVIKTSIKDIEIDYKNKLKEIFSSIESVEQRYTNLSKTDENIKADFKIAQEDSKEKIGEIKDSISKKQLYWIITIAGLALLLILVYLVAERKRAADKEDLLRKHKDIFEKQIEDGQKLANWLEEQSKERLAPQSEDPSAEIDHSFAIRVADEIVKNNANLSRMDESFKGRKQLKRSMQKLEKTLNANGYEIIDMLNKPYNEGMNATPIFVDDEELNKGEQIITRIIKPHITYKGKMIQAAEVQVSQG